MMPHKFMLVSVLLASLTSAAQPVRQENLVGIPYQTAGERELSRIGGFADIVWNARHSSVVDIREMLAADDAARRSLGLDAAMNRCRPDLLVEAVWLLGDDRPAIPQLHTDASTGEPFVSQPQPLSSHYRTLLSFWCLDLPPDDEPLRELLEQGLDPWAEVNPWWIRLQTLAAEQRLDELAEAKREFADAPENVRWLVVTKGQLNPKTRPAFTAAEIKAVLAALAPETKRAIADRTIELPRDYRRYREQGYEPTLNRLFDQYDNALTRSP